MRRTLMLAILPAVLLVGGCLHAPMPWSPDGRWIAYTIEVRPIEPMLRSGWLFETATRKPLVPPPNASRPTGYQLWATRAETGESVLLEDSKYPLTAPGWSPDGHSLAFGRIVVEAEDVTRFEVIVLEGGGRRRTISSRPIGVLNSESARLPGQAIAWSPDGRFMAIPQLNPAGLAIIRADNGRQINAINDAFLPSWSPDGSKLACFIRGAGDTLNCLDSPTGQPRMLTDVGQASQAASWTRDGLTLFVTARRSVPRAVDAPGDQVEMLKVRVDTRQAETLRSLTSDVGMGRDRTLEGVSVAFDVEGENLFCSTVIEGVAHQITWYRPFENAVYKKFPIIDHSVPMGSLSVSPDGRTLAARLGSLDRLSPPALCDLESPDLRSRLIAPDDASRVQWIATLVDTAQGILARLPTATGDPNGKASGPLERMTILPVPGEFEANTDESHRLQKLGRLGRPLCNRPHSAPPAAPEVVAFLEESRLFFDYLSRDYTAALASLERFEARAETPDRRNRLLGLRAQLFMAKGDVDRADQTITYLESQESNPPRRIEWNGAEYVVTETEPAGGRGWPRYLSWRSSQVRAQLHEEAPENHVNPDNPRFNFGLGPMDPRGNLNLPNDPFLINPVDGRVPPNREIPLLRPRMPMREAPEGVPKL